MLIEITTEEAAMMRGLFDLGFKSGGLGFAKQWGEKILALDAKIVAADEAATAAAEAAEAAAPRKANGAGVEATP